MPARSVAFFCGAMAASVAGAEAFRLLDVPLALILGSLVGAALFANLVGPFAGAAILRRVGQLVVGTAVGALLTGDVLGILGANILLMVALALAANLLGLLIAFPMGRLAGIDRLTAVLSCLPAGMAEMSSLAREVGADETAVAVAHSLRVILVVVSLPLLLGSLDAPEARAPELWEADPGFLVVLVAGGLLAAAARRLGALNPWVIAPMALGLLHAGLNGPVPAVPGPLLWFAEIAIGASLGARFQVDRLARLPRVAAASLLAAVVLIAAMAGGAASLAAAVSGLDWRTLVLAAAPGGLGEMIASAKALGLGASLVAGFQFVRSALTNLVAPALIKRWMT